MTGPEASNGGRAHSPDESGVPRRGSRAKRGEPGSTTPARPAASGLLAAGAARASGERRRRAGTPLISAMEPVEVSAARRAVAESGATGAESAAVPVPAAGRPEPRAEGSKSAPRRRRPPARRPRTSAGAAATRSIAESAAQSAPPKSAPPKSASARAASARAARPTSAPAAGRTRLRAVPSPDQAEPSAGLAAEPSAESTRAGSAADGRGQARGTGPTTPAAVSAAASHVSATAERLVGRFLEAADLSSDIRPNAGELIELAVNVLRAAATTAGVPAESVEREVAETLAYIRRRLTGRVEVDEFGFDADYTRHVHLPLLRPLYRRWFRVEVKGIENIPATGGALIVANHSGTIALDSLMTQVAVYDEHPQHRHLRMLGADLVFQMPFVGTMARRSGSTLAAHTDAERLLSKGELVGVWPEGFKGVGKPFSERYKLQRFGRGGFVSAALRARVPIVPCSIVGAEEIYPLIGNMPTVARLLGVPYAPITPTFPWLGPLGLLPLPSKWLIEFGTPIETGPLDTDGAEDPMVVFDLTDRVRETIQQTLYSLLMQRTSVFI